MQEQSIFFTHLGLIMLRQEIEALQQANLLYQSTQRKSNSIKRSRKSAQNYIP